MMEERTAKTVKTVLIFRFTCIENKEKWKLFNYEAVSSAFCLCHQTKFLEQQQLPVYKSNEGTYNYVVISLSINAGRTFPKFIPRDPAFSILDTALYGMFQGLRFVEKGRRSALQSKNSTSSVRIALKRMLSFPV